MALNENLKFLKSNTSSSFQFRGIPSTSVDHEEFASLDESQRVRVWQLSALLRLAIALNKERRNRVRRVKLDIEEARIAVHLKGKGDMLLERWAALRTAGYFEKAFTRRLQVDLNLQ